MRKITFRPLVLAGLFCCALCAAAGSRGAEQAWPERPVRVVVPFAPGASTDTIARLLGQKLTDALGQQFVVDNRPGAGGSLGAELVAHGSPDGYTLLLVNPGPAVNSILLRRKPPYAFSDFAPVFYIGSTPLIAVASAKFPPNDMKELIAYAKAHPGKVNWGSSGVSSNPHAALEALKAVTGANIVHVPYKGSAPALADAVAGQIDGLFTTTVTADAFIRNGRVKVLGVAGPKRQAVVPGVATYAEQGLTGADNLLWIGIVTTAKAPRPIIDKVNRELNRILQLPDIRKRFEQLGIDPEGGTPEDFGKLIAAQADALRELIRRGALRVE